MNEAAWLETRLLGHWNVKPTFFPAAIRNFASPTRNRVSHLLQDDHRIYMMLEKQSGTYEIGILVILDKG
jgi:hypothetical protein